jgi:DNA repair protein RadC
MIKSTLLTWQAAEINVSYESLTGIIIDTTQDLTDLLDIVFASTMPKPAYTALLLTKTNRLIGWADISMRHKSDVRIDNKKLICSAYLTSCHRLVVVHCGPVSVPTPQDGEYALCLKLQVVLGSYDVYLKDLILWSGSGYFSFEEAGMVLKE